MVLSNSSSLFLDGKYGMHTASQPMCPVQEEEEVCAVHRYYCFPSLTCPSQAGWQACPCDTEYVCMERFLFFFHVPDRQASQPASQPGQGQSMKVSNSMCALHVLLLLAHRLNGCLTVCVLRYFFLGAGAVRPLRNRNLYIELIDLNT